MATKKNKPNQFNHPSFEGAKKVVLNGADAVEFLKLMGEKGVQAGDVGELEIEEITAGARKSGSKDCRDHGKLIKTVPMKKEWLERRNAISLRRAKLHNEEMKIRAERDLMWADIEDDTGGHQFNLRFSDDDKHIEFYDHSKD